MSFIRQKLPVANRARFARGAGIFSHQPRALKAHHLPWRQRQSAEQDFTLWLDTFDGVVLLLANLYTAVYRLAPMNSSQTSFAKFQVQDLNAAIARNKNYDALPLTLSASELEPLRGYLQPFTLARDQVLIEQDAMDRTLYFVESGTLSVHRDDRDGGMTLALVGAGSVLGEGSFFSSLSRKASAIGSSPCRLWSLTVNRFMALANRQPALALQITLALGAVVAKWVENSPRRAAVV